MSPTRRIAYTTLSIAGAVLTSAIALKALPVPFFWMGSACAVLAVALALLAPAAARWPLLLGASALAAFSLAELLFAFTVRPEIARTPPAYEADPVLGWKPKPSQVLRASSTFGANTIFEVTYSIDAHGQRIAPPVRQDRIDGCVFFFVDSFVFGDGVEDREAIPYQFGLKTGGRYQVVNLATSGYGAEHMLASVERGKLASTQPCAPTHLVYVALPHHVHRAAGKQWSIRGPRYQLLADGTPGYVGTNPDAEAQARAALTQSHPAWKARLQAQLVKSWTHRALTSRPAPTAESEIDLYFAIVRQAFRLFERRWPDAERHVISWEIHDFYANGLERFRHGIQSVGAKVHYIDDILPGYTSDPVRYGLHRYDLHPNAMAHEKVAAYLATRLDLGHRSMKP